MSRKRDTPDPLFATDAPPPSTPSTDDVDLLPPDAKRQRIPSHQNAPSPTPSPSPPPPPSFLTDHTTSTSSSSTSTNISLSPPNDAGSSTPLRALRNPVPDTPATHPPEKRRRKRKHRTHSSRMDKLLGQVPVEVWERVVAHLDACSTLALFSVNSLMVEMGDLFTVCGEPLRASLVKLLGDGGTVQVTYHRRVLSVPRMDRLLDCDNQLLGAMFAERSVPTHMHVRDLPRVCGKSRKALECVLRNTSLTQHSQKALKNAMMDIVGNEDALYWIVKDKDLSVRVKRTEQGLLGEIYDGNSDAYAAYPQPFRQGRCLFGAPDAKDRDLAAVPLQNIVRFIDWMEARGAHILSVSNALSQILRGHGLAAVQKLHKRLPLAFHGMAQAVVMSFPRHQWTETLDAILALLTTNEQNRNIEAEYTQFIRSVQTVMLDGKYTPVLEWALSTLPFDRVWSSLRHWQKVEAIGLVSDLTIDLGPTKVNLIYAELFNNRYPGPVGLSTGHINPWRKLMINHGHHLSDDILLQTRDENPHAVGLLVQRQPQAIWVSHTDLKPFHTKAALKALQLRWTEQAEEVRAEFFGSPDRVRYLSSLHKNKREDIWRLAVSLWPPNDLADLAAAQNSVSTSSRSAS